MDSLYHQEVHFKPVDNNYGWQLDNLTAARTGPIFGGRTISAMGTRPRDHMDRDLLLASLLRDRRLPMFRKQCLNLPAWVAAMPEDIPATFQHRAQQLVMLGSTHQHFIEQMRASIDLADDRSKGEQMLKAMEACPPRGALFAHGTLDSGRPCRNARLCPWCHARSVQRLYGLLQAGPCLPERLTGKHLILFKTRVDGGDELDAQELREVRNDYRYKLRWVARQCGIEGGVILHQVTPWMPWYDRPSEKQKIFAHVFAFIGVVASSSVDSIGPAIRKACEDQWIDRDYEVMLLPATVPDALRYLLLGTSYKFDPSRVGLLAKNSKSVVYGIQGAAALQPWFLFDEQQAWSYVAAMHGTRLFDTFGNWRESQADQKRCSRKRRAQSEHGGDNRKMAFQCENECRRHDAKTRRRELATIALPILRKFKDAGGKHLGSPALRKMLSEAGHSISDRDARWLAKELPSMDKRTAFEKFVARRKLDLESRPRIPFHLFEQSDSSVA